MHLFWNFRIDLIVDFCWLNWLSVLCFLMTADIRLVFGFLKWFLYLSHELSVMVTSWCWRLKMKTICGCWWHRLNVGALRYCKKWWELMTKSITNILKLTPIHFVSNIRQRDRCNRVIYVNGCSTVSVVPVPTAELVGSVTCSDCSAVLQGIIYSSKPEI